MKVIATFAATDGDGNDYRIHVLQGYHDVTTQWDSQPVVEADALKEMRTSDGRFVNFVGPGEYDIIDGTRLIRVTSTDPAAP